MAGDDNSGSGHTCDGVQGMEALRVGLQTQDAALRSLVENVDRRFQVFEGCFDEIANRFYALVLGANRDENENRQRLRGDVA